MNNPVNWLLFLVPIFLTHRNDGQHSSRILTITSQQQLLNSVALTAILLIKELQKISKGYMLAACTNSFVSKSLFCMKRLCYKSLFIYNSTGFM